VFHCVGTCYLMCPRLLLFLCLASERRHEGHAWIGDFGREHPPRCSLVCPLRLRLLHLLLRVSAAPIIFGMRVFSFRQTTVAPRWGGRCIPFLGALLMQMTPSAPLAAGRLLAVFPDVAELLAVMALRKTILSSIYLHPDCHMAVETFPGILSSSARVLGRGGGLWLLISRRVTDGWLSSA
jgi:hypothetical protein